MKQPNEVTLKALANLKGNAFFVHVVKWFEESREEERDSMEQIENDVTLRQGQGRVQTMSEFLKAVSTAPAVLAGIRERPQQENAGDSL